MLRDRISVPFVLSPASRTARNCVNPPTSCFRAVLLLLCAVCFCALPSQGQVVTATLYGSITDQTGAAVPDASVVATNVATGIATKTTANATGSYILPSLSPGTYNLKVEKTGFRSAVLSGITLLVDQQAVVNAQLQVGAVATTVEVTSAAPLVETTTASVGTVIGDREVVDLPLNLRRITSLATLVPGTVSASGFGYAAYVVGGSPFSEATYVAGGARDSSNTLLIDGMESRAYDTGGFALAPPPDAVQEFKIQTNIYSSVFGKTAGSTMNTVTKSGSNELHGDAYEFLRNDRLDARNFFASDQTNPVTGQEIPGSARPEFRRNQFGATLGGPIRRAKTFFFGFYDATREVKGLTLGNPVPTDAERAGNFSNFLTGTTANLCAASGTAAPPGPNLVYDTGQLFDPASLSNFTCPANPAVPGSTPYTILRGNPIPGNIITTIDPVALKVLAGFPEPNRPGFPNFVNQTPRVRSDNQFGVRLDHSFGSGDQLFGRYIFAQSRVTDPSAGYTSLPGFGDKIFFRGQNIVMGWTHTFGAHLLNEATVGFQRNNPVENCQQCPRANDFLETFGVKGLKSIGAGIEQFPFFGFSNFGGVGDAGYRPISNVEMTEDYGDNLTWTRGRHTIVVGTDLQWLQNLRQQNPYSPGSQWTFNGQFSSLASEIPSVGGVSDLADLELGFPAFVARSLGYRDVNQVGSTFWNWYGQDDIRLNPNLSLNVGLRYEYRRNPIDKLDNIVSFMPLGPKFSGPGNAALLTVLSDTANDALCSDPNHANLVSATGQCLVVSSAQRRQFGFTGRTRQTLIFPDRRDFAPRIGLTWRPTASDRLVIRTGYGIFYDLANLNTKEFVSGNPIFSPTQIFNTTFGSPPPLTNGLPTTTENAFQSGSVPLLRDQYAALWFDPHSVTPRIQQWSLGIESQLAPNWGLDVSYVGARASHLDALHFFGNQARPGTGILQPRRPYPDFNNLAYFSTDANSRYSALQAKLTKRFSDGLQFLTAYTYGKTISDQEGNEGSFGGSGNLPQDESNRQANYGRAVSDARQRMTFSPIWQLPVGSGQRFMNRTGIVNQVLGHWQVSGILTLQSGFPFTVLSGFDYSNSGSTSARPDRTCSGVGRKTVASWYDASCFTIGALQQALLGGSPRFGNSGRNILDGPGIAGLDFALYKDFSLSERFKLRFRAEAYNIFNQAHFGLPNSTCNTTSTSTCAPGPTDFGNNVGRIGGAGEPRDIQFGLKLLF